MVKYFSYFILIAALTIACHSGKTRKDDEIDLGLRKMLKQYNEQIIEGCYEKNPAKVLELTSKKFRQRFEEGLKQNIVTKGSVFDIDKFVLLNEFHCDGLMRGVHMDISSGSSGMHDYYLPVIPQSAEIYLTVGYFDTPEKQISLILLWMREKGKWRLNFIHAGTLMFCHKDVVDWFEETKLHLLKEEYCDAALKLMVVDKLLNKEQLPLIYLKEKEIKLQGKKMVSQIKEKLSFPDEINILASRPSVFQIFPNIRNDTLFPVVQYVSKIDAKDTISINKECDSLHRILGDLYKGIDKNHKSVIYQVFDKKPQTFGATPCYTFRKEFDYE